MSPLMLVALRFVLAAVLARALARAFRGPLRVSRADAMRIAASGFVLNGVQFGAMYLAFDAGLGAALASLMHSLSPVLTAAPPLLALALLVEGTDVVRDPAAAGIALVYLAVVNSIVGLGLLGILVRARGAGAAASIFFLMPPATAVLAWLVLGETLDLREIVGIVITVLGVAAATRTRRPAAASGAGSGSPGEPGREMSSHHQPADGVRE